jgi:epoxide hydrolase 4
MAPEPRFDCIDTGAAQLRYAMMGDPGRPLILCLHGFPEFWIAWREVMIELSREFFLVAPDQRGYNRSSRPDGVHAYGARHLVADIVALADQLSPERRFVLAGHDWGASVAYAYAFAHPERLSHLVIANGVHPACFQRAIFDDPGQRRASQYINRLRAPEADERMVENGFARTSRMMEGFSKTGWMTPALKEEYVAAWGQPGAMTAMLNWYRASPIEVPAPDAPPGEARVLSLPAEALTVRMPHLVIWGEADEALRPSCLAGLERHAPELTIRRFPEAGHWILHEKPAEVATAMGNFIND